MGFFLMIVAKFTDGLLFRCNHTLTKDEMDMDEAFEKLYSECCKGITKWFRAARQREGRREDRKDG